MLFLLFLGFYFSFIPESSFFSIDHLAFDHRTYYPLVFLFLFVGGVLCELEVWKRKYFKAISFTLVFVYFILNQARNFQIKPVTNWNIHTLENSISHHSINYNMTATLIQEKKFEELAPIIQRYKQEYSDRLEYQILIDAYLFHTVPEMRRELLYKLSNYLEQPINHVFLRAWLNALIINGFFLGARSFEDKIFLERILSRQLTQFFNPQDKFAYIGFIDFYYKLSTTILSEKSSPTNTLDKIEIMRIKTILYYYYGMGFDGLRDEVLLAFKADPGSSVLNRLYEMMSVKPLVRLNKK